MSSIGPPGAGAEEGSPPGNSAGASLKAPAAGGAAGPRTTTSRACTRCRKHKSKCIYAGSPEDPGTCRRCEDAKTPCVFPPPVAPPTVHAPTTAERLNRMEERQGVLERALRSLGVDLDDLDGTLSELPLLAAVAAGRTSNQQSNRSKSLLVEHLDKDDVTSTDLLRFGREQRDDSPARPRKRQRQATTPDIGEPDISQQQLAFDIFSKRCCVSIPFLEPDAPDHTIQNIRQRSELLFWAIVAVGAREADELAETHGFARRRAVDLSRLTFGRRPPTTDDFKGFAIVQVWLAPIRPVGHLISLAHELDLHKAPSKAATVEEVDPEMLEQVRMWCFVAVTDGLFSEATGKPRQVLPVYAALPSRVVDLLMASGRVRDERLLAQLELIHLMSVEPLPEQPASGGGLSEDFRHFQERNAKIDLWGEKWRQWGSSNTHPEGVFSPSASILIQFSYAKLHVNFGVLRGIKSADDISQARLLYVQVAVNHAQDLLRVALAHYQPPVISYTSEYTHLAVNFAAVFLLKICRLIPSALDLPTIFQQISDITILLGHIRGRFHSEALQFMHQHVAGELRDRAAKSPVFAGTQDLDVLASLAGDSVVPEASGLLDEWMGAVTAPAFWGWDTNWMGDGLQGAGYNTLDTFDSSEGLEY